VVLRDQNGELITPIVQNGILDQGMPKFALSAADITDIAAWLHSQPLSDRGAPTTLDILVGDARDGAAYFNGAGHCTQCHSTTGDLAGIGTRYEPKTIQNLIVSGGSGRSFGRRSAGSASPNVPPRTVTVTPLSGQTISGALDHISAFVVALREPDGTYRSFARHDSIPKVVVTNPLQWGGLLFANDGSGNLVAFGLRGTQPPVPLWHAHIGSIENAAETYTVGGRQYVLVTAEGALYAFYLQ